MPRVGIWTLVILGVVRTVCAETLSVVEREVNWIAADSSYQITLGIDHTGPSELEPMAAWQLVCRMFPNNLDVNAAVPTHYLFDDGAGNSGSLLGYLQDESTTSFYDYYTDSPRVPEAGANDNLVRIDLKSPGATEPFNFQLVFVPFNDSDLSGSLWYTDPNLPPRPFDLSSVAEPSCIQILLSGVVVIVTTMVKRGKYAHRVLSSRASKTSGFNDPI
jgi:hypothetical protein